MVIAFSTSSWLNIMSAIISVSTSCSVSTKSPLIISTPSISVISLRDMKNTFIGELTTPTIVNTLDVSPIVKFIVSSCPTPSIFEIVISTKTSCVCSIVRPDSRLNSCNLPDSFRPKRLIICGLSEIIAFVLSFRYGS